MFKKIIGTIGTRVLTALLALITWTLNANYLGPENLGTISLIILSVTIIQLFTNFVSGAALIYLTPRTGIYKLFIPAYLWSFAVAILTTFLLQLLGFLVPVLEIIPAGYFLPVMFLALVMSFASANYMLLLGLEKVRSFNLISLAQVVVLFIVLLFMLFGIRLNDVMAYYWPLFISYSLAMAAGLVLLYPSFKKVPLTNMKELLMEILRFGTFVQVANIFQTMNYRLSLKFVDFYIGRGAVGVLSLGMQLAEGMWLISRSIATVQYSRLSNEMNYDYSVKLTLTLAKITWMVTGLGMLLLLAVPEFVFTAIFTAKFGDIKMVIASLAIGIVTLSVSMIFSGFFSAINKPFHNTISSGIGLVFTVGFGLLLIPKYGLMGAGITATISYSLLTLYQFIVFSRMTRLGLRDFMLTRSEVRMLMLEVRKVVTRDT
ncbi:MAG: polysaccharide biosynthesis C-terminal domain-containing protein [Bacteroidetes bacterium]|nr:polysaccharide biosynthesis C-terminal domain-containing protein [Bacteroidota bacterium]